MTSLLEEAFAKAAKLPEAEQELLASWLLAELDEENVFDRKITLTSNRLVGMAQEALNEVRSKPGR